MVQRGLGILPNQGGARRAEDIRRTICPSVISPQTGPTPAGHLIGIVRQVRRV